MACLQLVSSYRGMHADIYMLARTPATPQLPLYSTLIVARYDGTRLWLKGFVVVFKLHLGLKCANMFTTVVGV